MDQFWPPAIIVLCLSIKCRASQAAQAGVTDKTHWENQLIIAECEGLELWV